MKRSYIWYWNKNVKIKKERRVNNEQTSGYLVFSGIRIWLRVWPAKGGSLCSECGFSGSA